VRDLQLRQEHRAESELARIAASKGYDLIVAANEPEIDEIGAHLRDFGVAVDVLNVDLATIEGVDRLYEAVEADGCSVDPRTPYILPCGARSR
jgi:short-subunit dehydrogenase